MKKAYPAFRAVDWERQENGTVRVIVAPDYILHMPEDMFWRLFTLVPERILPPLVVSDK